jgi:pimeloyl-ACP methyl ester carboxylesterase
MQAIGFTGEIEPRQRDYSSKPVARVVRQPVADGARGDGRSRVHVFAGDTDGLVDLACLERNLSNYDTTLQIVPGYEHMDTIWADSAADVVFPSITGADI